MNLYSYLATGAPYGRKDDAQVSVTSSHNKPEPKAIAHRCTRIPKIQNNMHGLNDPYL